MEDSKKAKLIEKEKKRIQKVKMGAVINHPFWGTLLVSKKILIDLTIPTFGATDTKTIRVNPLFTQHLNLQQLGFVVIHEIAHIVYLHFLRMGERDREVWNMAADYRVNLDVVQLENAYGRKLYELPNISANGFGFTVLYDTKFSEMTTEEIYKILIKEKGKPKGSPCFSGSFIERGRLDEHQPFEGTPEDVEGIEGEIMRAYRAWEASGKRGTLPGGLEKCIEELFKPRISWQHHLNRFLKGALTGKEEYTYSPINRRYLISSGLIMPSLKSPALGDVVIHIDSSGSTQGILEVFASEMSGLCGLTDEATVIIGDAEVQQVIKAGELGKFLKGITFRGGGGTDHRPVFEYLKENKITPSCFIGFTDLESAFPEEKPSYPVLWAIPENSPAKPPWGEVIHIPGER